jgi:hypothetical protein
MQLGKNLRNRIDVLQFYVCQSARHEKVRRRCHLERVYVAPMQQFATHLYCIGLATHT